MGWTLCYIDAGSHASPKMLHVLGADGVYRPLAPDTLFASVRPLSVRTIIMDLDDEASVLVGMDGLELERLCVAYVPADKIPRHPLQYMLRALLPGGTFSVVLSDQQGLADLDAFVGELGFEPVFDLANGVVHKLHHSRVWRKPN
jgi:hypothetical protein